MADRVVYDRAIVLFFSPSVALALSIALTSAAPPPTVAQPAPPSGVVFPHEERGACPFACCPAGRWIARSPLTVRRARAVDAPPAFTLDAGEAVEGVDGVLVTLRPGRARALTGVELGGVRVGKDEEVLVLGHSGAGALRLVAHGRVVVTGPAPGAARFRLLAEPRTVSWVQVRNRQGETGWSNEPERFDGTAGCG
jgi:hypothetical protein